MSKAQSVLKNVSSVPKILHQVFASERVYANYLPFVNSCLSRNPDWQYYLWTDKTAEKLIVDRYPEFLAKYKQYTDNLEKADSIRYIVLHHMGGIYLDMDVECIRPFFPALEGIQAFLDQERPEQTNIGLAQRYSAMNSAMGARPGHPFFRHVIDQLRAGTRVGEALRTTGPLALTSALESYRRVGAAAGVKLLDPKVFSPLMVDMNKWKKRCRRLHNFNFIASFVRQVVELFSLVAAAARLRPAPGQGVARGRQQRQHYRAAPLPAPRLRLDRRQAATAARQPDEGLSGQSEILRRVCVRRLSQT
ncbi:hypothetical protein BOX15_Mlig000950g2 [Macrostomum lignano]|uniref:Uncharacterized protein n=1 Tax=Macrostomum lignano TaxID=282301 RepID=A0A267EQ38_9PLAT|nr:hypothetical protein BOX15_Mlig000950g2 [Macrostomum lignano]